VLVYAYIYIVLFCRYINHDCEVRFVRTDYGDECDCHRLYVRLIYWASFSFGEEHIGPTYVITLHMHVHE
jgi:hypothetical protein